MSDPLEELLSLAERSYVRMQAKELITQVFVAGDLAIFDALLQRLVLAGEASLGVMREIMEEIRSTKSTLGSEGLGARQDLMDALKQFGVRMPTLLTVDPPEALRQICSQKLRLEVKQAAKPLEAEDEALLQEICVDASERVARIARELHLLRQIESSVLDWFSGLAYEAAHTRSEGGDSGSPRLLH